MPQISIFSIRLILLEGFYQSCYCKIYVFLYKILGPICDIVPKSDKSMVVYYIYFHCSDNTYSVGETYN